MRFWFEESMHEADAVLLLAAAEQGLAAGRTTRDGLSPEQFLRDRPDVFRAFYEEFHGPRNDHHSSAWLKRVGGATPEDYANYWYEQHGRWEGYTQGSGASAPREAGDLVLPPGIVETGRTTVEGHLISQILAERPDAFRAFFTEYYGPNNDHNSTAWLKRVGGATPEDYANYWWETYGRASGWTPSQRQSSPDAEDGEDAVQPPQDLVAEPPLRAETPVVFVHTDLGVIMRPIEPDDIVEGGFVIGRRASNALESVALGEGLGADTAMVGQPLTDPAGAF